MNEIVNNKAQAPLPAKHSPTFQGLRIGKKTAKALEVMAYEGLSLPLAAKRYSMRTDNLNRAFSRPEVKERFNQLVKSIRDGAGVRAHLRIDHLSQTSESDHVQLEGSKWLAGVADIAPIKRVQGKFSHNHTFGGFTFGDYEEEKAKDITPPLDQTSSDADE